MVTDRRRKRTMRDAAPAMTTVGGGGWTMLSQLDGSGRTVYSIYIGGELVVADEADPNIAVARARQATLDMCRPRQTERGAAS